MGVMLLLLGMHSDYKCYNTYFYDCSWFFTCLHVLCKEAPGKKINWNVEINKPCKIHVCICDITQFTLQCSNQNVYRKGRKIEGWV